MDKLLEKMSVEELQKNSRVDASQWMGKIRPRVPDIDSGGTFVYEDVTIDPDMARRIARSVRAIARKALE